MSERQTHYWLEADEYLVPYGVTLKDLAIWLSDKLPRMESFRSKTLCPQWWEHPEVVERFAALHQEWGTAVKEKTLSSWWMYHWPIHAERIFDRHGPMQDCREPHANDPRAGHLGDASEYSRVRFPALAVSVPPELPRDPWAVPRQASGD